MTLRSLGRRAAAGRAGGRAEIAGAKRRMAFRLPLVPGSWSGRSPPSCRPVARVWIARRLAIDRNGFDELAWLLLDQIAFLGGRIAQLSAWAAGLTVAVPGA